MATVPKQRFRLPEGVQWTITTLEKAGYDAYAVGGGVRDMLLGRNPKDWDITTNAKPADIKRVFPKSVYDNRFGTVAVRRGDHIFEVTTYRAEFGYSDARHPDSVSFVDRLEDDLARRDFTVNAMALRKDEIVDPFDGQADLKEKSIRAVGAPRERFAEDALRMLRAIRLAVELGFQIDPATQAAVREHAASIKKVSGERARDELMRILASPEPYRGLVLMFDTGLLEELIPELLEGRDMYQPRHHKSPVLEHNLLSLKHVPSEDPLLRLAALLHDVGKPRSARGPDAERTFHGHEVIGARMVQKIMQRLRFSKADITRVVNLVRHHMFLFQFESTDKAVRRIIRRVGPEHVSDLVTLRVGDRLGSGTKVGYTKKLQRFQERVEEVQRDPIDTRMLAVNGNDLMKSLKLTPGPKIGELMNQLLEEVLDDPSRNTKAYLLRRAAEYARNA